MNLINCRAEQSYDWESVVTLCLLVVLNVPDWVNALGKGFIRKKFQWKVEKKPFK